MKLILAALVFATTLAAQSLVVTPDNPTVTSGGVTAAMIPQRPECPPQFAIYCGYDTNQLQFTYVLGASTAQFTVTYTLEDGTVETQTQEGESFDAGSCSVEFIIPGGATVTQVQVDIGV